MFRVVYHPEVVDDIARLGTKEKQRIKKAIETKISVMPLTFGKPLQYSLNGLRSLRIGEYRVIFKSHEKVVIVLLIAHRSVVYTKMKSRL